jgi:hypothetical protein
MFYLQKSKIRQPDDHKTDQMVRLAPTQCIDSRQCCHHLGKISRSVQLGINIRQRGGGGG